ncbi:hypothetical protein VSH64_07345 [Amycolatopsis rhabdoformis]|uniref:Uncharacterized protein n=1 Tax=Amycolatopsis rhabdoformis TaxID=1448059 RepID=A0ABZ1IE34_9PSEU|nr:hypothetical protein [Amycolatopsis rhabdoformis]WSE31923.1 hypothetical protein VSH64_07345 [Amycolatopsis rhabdoformis]
MRRPRLRRGHDRPRADGRRGRLARFGWQTDYDPEVFFDKYEGLGPFRFSRAQYDAVFA